LYTFDDAILVADVFDWGYFTRGHLTGKPWVNEEKTERMLEHFSRRTNVVNECIGEVERLKMILIST
jgi:hypothetical protein